MALSTAKRNEIISRLKAGECVYMLKSHVDDACTDKGKVYHVTDVGSGTFTCIITPENRTKNPSYRQNGSRIPISTYEDGWVFESDAPIKKETKKKPIDVVIKENEVNFIFSLDKKTLGAFLEEAAFNDVGNSEKMALLLTALNKQSDHIKTELNNFLFDEEFGIVYQEAEEIYGPSQSFQFDVDDDTELEDDDDYDDEEDEEGYF